MEKLINELNGRIDRNSHYSTETGRAAHQVYQNALAAAQAGNKDGVRTALGFLLGLGGDERLVEYEKLLVLLEC